jgi:alpha-L-rhamnosidase
MIDRREFLIASGATAGLAAVPMNPVFARSERVKVVGLKADHLDSPLGLENRHPLLSWRIKSAERNVSQSAYRIRVASSQTAIENGRADVWDSGKVLSRRSFEIRYDGKALASRQRCWWRVEVWDNHGKAFESAPDAWEMGLLNRDDWSAQWLAVEDATARADREAGLNWMWGEETKSRSRLGFRRRISLPAAARDGEIYVVANDWVAWTQIIRVWLDGRPLAGFGMWQSDGDRIGVTESSSVRITLPSISAGEHLLAIEVEAAAIPNWGEDVNLEHMHLTHGVAALMRLNLDNGQVERITTGPDWKTASVESEGWSQPDFDDHVWVSARSVALESQPWPAAPAMWLRRAFTLSQPVTQARLYVTALGAYEARLNGQRVGNALLTPEPSYYAKHVLYRVHDVTHIVKPGDNALGLTVGDGWYASFDDRYAFGPPPRRVIAQLEITLPDGTREIIATGPDWRICNSSILESQIRIGETQDARLEQPDWDTAQFDDSHWMPAQVADKPSGALVAQTDSPIRAVQELTPVSITEPKPGVYVADFGKNFTGWCRLRVRGARSERVELAYAEILGAKGEIEQPFSNIGWPKKDVYILKGDPTGEMFEPHFTYRGFRYVQLTGLSAPATADTLTGIYIHTDLEQTGTIRSDSVLLEEIWRATAHTHDAILIGLPIDTPSREARAYAEVPEIMWDGLSYDRDTGALARRVMDVFVDNQLPTGNFPRRVLTPCYNNAMEETVVGSSPGWGEVGIILPWTAWQHYGDTAIIERYWTAMNRHVQFILDNNPDYIWRNARGHDHGDWFALDVIEANTGLPHTSKEVLGTAFWARDLDLLAQMSDAIARPAETARLRDTLAKVRSAFADGFVKEDGTVGNASQTCYVLALAFDLVPARLRDKAAGRLVVDIRSRGTSLTTGILGTHFILDTLAASGHTDMAYDLLLRKDYPSWGHMLRDGGGTIWETWSGYVEAKTPSGSVRYPMGRSHPDLASATGFLFRHFAGIAPATPGFETVTIRPKFDPRITSGGGDYISLMGPISTDWTLSSRGEFSLTVKIPANCRAKVHLPAPRGSRITEGRFDVSRRRDLYSVTRGDSEAVIGVSSGTYKFRVES